MRYDKLCGVILLLLTLACASACRGQDISYAAGENRTGDITGSANLEFSYPPGIPAPQSGDISGGSGDVLTITGN